MARLLVDAIQNGDTASAKDIIKKGNYGCIDGQTWRRDGTALFFCCSRGYLELASALIEKGANVNSTDKSMATPLHGAVDNGHLMIVKLLLENGANVNAQTSRGDSPLHLSAYRGHAEITHCLVEAGADHELVNVSNLTAQREAFSQGHTDVSNYLMSIEDSTFLEENLSFYSMIQLDPPSDLDTSPPARGQQTKLAVSRCHEEEPAVVKSGQLHQNISEKQRQCNSDKSMNEIFLLDDSGQIYLTIDPPAHVCPHNPSSTEVYPHIPLTSTHMHTHAFTKNQVYPQTPTSPKVYQHTPTSPQFYPHTPISSQVYSHPPASPLIFPHTPASPQVYPYSPTSPQVYPHTPTSPQVYPHTPTSPQVYPHTPTSPQVCPHCPVSPHVYPHISLLAQENSHRQKLHAESPINNLSLQTKLEKSQLSETDERRNCPNGKGCCLSSYGHTYLSTRPSSGSACGYVSDNSSSTHENDLWSFLSSDSGTSGYFDSGRRKDIHSKSYSYSKDVFDSKEVQNLGEKLGVRFPPNNDRVRSSKSPPLTDFSNILDVSLFSLSTLSSTNPSTSSPFYAKSLTTNHFKNSLKTCRASSVNESAYESSASRPVFNKSFSVEPKPLRGPRHSLNGSCLHLDHLPSNDLSGSSYVSISSMASKTSSSMTCINIPLN